MSRNRTRHSERFAAVPLTVMQSLAVTTLPHAARSVLFVLAAQFAGTANGVQNLCRATCKRYGLSHSRALKYAKLLEEHGLVVCTYRARYSAARSRVPSQWALAWRPITHAGNQELGVIRPPPNGWQDWTPEKILSGQSDRSSGKTADNPTAVAESNCGPMGQRSPQNCGQSVQPSKNLGRVSRTAAKRRRAG